MNYYIYAQRVSYLCRNVTAGNATVENTNVRSAIAGNVTAGNATVGNTNVRNADARNTDTRKNPRAIIRNWYIREEASPLDRQPITK